MLTWPPDRDRPGLHHHLAERAVEPVLRAGAIGDVGDAADHVAGEGARGLALRGGAVGVGDVVAREVRIGDRRRPVELVEIVLKRLARCRWCTSRTTTSAGHDSRKHLTLQ